MRRMAAFPWALFAAALLFPAGLQARGQYDATGSEGPLQVSFMMKLDGGEQTSWCIQEIERELGIRIVPNGVDGNERENVAALAASGELPDVIVQADWYELFGQGLTRSIPRSAIEEYMPNYTRRASADFPTAWLTYLVRGKRDEYVAITGVSEATATNLWCVGFREDWAEKVGMPVPDFETKKISLDEAFGLWYVDEDLSLEWFQKLLIALRDGDPDGNGKSDTIPLGASRSFPHSWSSLLGAFGVGQGCNLVEDGRLVDWRISRGYRDFLKLMQEWYRAGLIDKEFASLELGSAWKKVAEHRVGALASVMTDYAGMEYARSWPPNSFVTSKEVAAGAAVVLVPPVVGPGGKRGASTYSPFATGVYGWGLSAKVDDVKAARVLGMMDWLFLGKEDQWVMARFGQSGVHFHWQGEPWHTPAIPVPQQEVPAGHPKLGPLGSDYPAYNTMDRLGFSYPAKNRAFKEYLLREGKRYTIGPYRYDLLGETGLHALELQRGGILAAYADEFMVKAITADIDVDREWNGYVSRWLANGGSAMLAEAAKAPLYAELRKGVLNY